MSRSSIIRRQVQYAVLSPLMVADRLCKRGACDGATDNDARGLLLCTGMLLLLLLLLLLCLLPQLAHDCYLLLLRCS